MSTLKTTNLQHASAATPAIVLASSGSATAQLSSINDGPIAGMRNLVINGGFDIWQRGTSFSSSSVNEYSVDRFRTEGFNVNSVISQQTFTVGQTDVPGFPTYYCRVTTSSAPSNYWGFQQRIEAPHVIGQGTQTYTLSFWAKAVSGTIAANTFEYGIAGTRTGNPELTTSWQKITYTFSASISGTFASLYIVRLTSSVSSLSVDIANVQLEPGSVATPFERRSYGQELALCQRYYYRHAEGAGRIIAYGTYWSAAQFEAGVFFPVTMRTTPTLEQTTGTDYYYVAANSTYDYLDSLSTANGNTNGLLLFNGSQSAGTAGHGGRLQTNNAAAQISFSAEF